jgi:hypothetical protein
MESPEWWNSPWLIERAHIVWAPRVEDRRAVVLLCSRCHCIQHGDKFSFNYPPVTRANLLWLKWKYDPEFYDTGFLRCHSVNNLPKKQVPHQVYRHEFLKRRENPIEWVPILKGTDLDAD